MKIGVSSYSFSQYLRDGRLDLFGAVEKAAELGFDNIEFTELTPPDGVDVLDFASQIKQKAKECSIGISAYVVAANLAQPDDASLEAEVNRVKKQVDIASALGAVLFRHDVMYNYDVFRSYKLALPTIAKGARMITEYAQKLGIRTMTENHGYIFQDSYRVEELVSEVNHPNYGLLADIGNFMCADENPVLSLSRVASLAFMVHAKDFKFIPYSEKSDEGFTTRACNRLVGVSVGYGDIGAEQCFALLKRAGFDGCVDVEYEGTCDCIEGIKKSIDYIKSVIE